MPKLKQKWEKLLIKLIGKQSTLKKYLGKN